MPCPEVRTLSPRLLLFGLALLVLPLIQGCWTLESYVARVNIAADGTYTYVVDGSAAHAETVYAVRRADYEARTGKQLKPEDIQKMKDAAEATLTKDLEAARKDPRVQNVKAVGQGRVRFTLVGKGSINGGAVIFQAREAPLAYAQAPDGALSVWLKDAVVDRSAEALGVHVDGDVSIKLAEGVQVLSHNAWKTPTVPGGAYRWRVESLSQPAPRLVIRLPKQ